jgi:Helix-turn-helix domain
MNAVIAAVAPMVVDHTGVRGKLSVSGAAEYLNVSESFLNKLRCSGGGPEFFKIGTRIVYDITTLDAFLEQRRRRSTADGGEGA